MQAQLHMSFRELPPKVRRTIILAGVLAACELLVPGIAIGVALFRHAAVDETGRQIAIVLGIAMPLLAASMVAGAVLLRRGRGAGRLLIFLGILGLFPLALLGLALMFAIGVAVESDDVKQYLAACERARRGR